MKHFHWNKSKHSFPSVFAKKQPDQTGTHELLPELNPSVPALEITHFTKGFKGVAAVRNISFKVGRGVIHGFLGHNGAGKTTTIKTVIGAMKKDMGAIKVYGYDCGTVDANRMIGYIPESARFPRRMSCFEYMVTMARLSGVSSKDAADVAERILREIGLWDVRKRNPNFFSSGMAKKVLLAQSLINDPHILILDEPAENLDPSARKQLYDELLKYRNEGRTIFISSHVLAEIEPIVDEITVMKMGRVLYSGRVRSVINSATPSILINTSNNFQAIDGLRQAGFSCYEDSKGIIVNSIDSETQIRAVSDAVNKLNLTIVYLVKNQRSLQDFYQQMSNVKL